MLGKTSDLRCWNIGAASTPEDTIQKREAHWKKALLTREYGLNSN